MSNSSAPWTDLGSILADTDGKACLYGYLEKMDGRHYKNIELLDEVAQFRYQVEQRHQCAKDIKEKVANSRLGNLWKELPSPEQLQQLELCANLFDQVEEAARENLKPFVQQFLSDVKKGEIKQRVKKSGYLAFSKKFRK